MTTKPKKPSKPTRARSTKPAKRKRSAIDGEFGSGEKAAEKLARRIVTLCYEARHKPVGEVVTLVMAELLAATTVEERVERVLWRGWARVTAAGDTGPGWCWKQRSYAADDCNASDTVVRVRLVAEKEK